MLLYLTKPKPYLYSCSPGCMACTRCDNNKSTWDHAECAAWHIHNKMQCEKAKQHVCGHKVWTRQSICLRPHYNKQMQCERARENKIQARNPTCLRRVNTQKKCHIDTSINTLVATRKYNASKAMNMLVVTTNSNTITRINVLLSTTKSPHNMQCEQCTTQSGHLPKVAVTDLTVFSGSPRGTKNWLNESWCMHPPMKLRYQLSTPFWLVLTSYLHLRWLSPGGAPSEPTRFYWLPIWLTRVSRVIKPEKLRVYKKNMFPILCFTFDTGNGHISMSRLQKKYQICAEYRRHTLFSRLYDRFDLEIDDIIKPGLVDDDENNFDWKKVNDNFL